MEREDVRQALTDLAREVLAPLQVDHLQLRPDSDIDGEEVLRVTVVLRPERAREITGRQGVDMLLRADEVLRQAGDGRRARVRYATTEDLVRSGVTGP